MTPRRSPPTPRARRGPAEERGGGGCGNGPPRPARPSVAAPQPRGPRGGANKGRAGRGAGSASRGRSVPRPGLQCRPPHPPAAYSGTAEMGMGRGWETEERAAERGSPRGQAPLTEAGVDAGDLRHGPR